MKVLKVYLPLVKLLLISFSGAAVLSSRFFLEDSVSLMAMFMGFFLLCFSFLKILDVEGFSRGFQKYDLLANRWKPYGKIYPFIELGLGLSYLGGYCPVLTNIVMVVVMFFGAIGVYQSLQRKEKLTCACMGSALNLPLGKVTLVEDLVMGLMALWMLFRLL